MAVQKNTVYKVLDMHTAGEPVRIVTEGYPPLVGSSLLQKRRDAIERHDDIRRLLMHEPRGHQEMYGVIPTDPSAPGCALAVLFTHNSGYSTMCGHATVALGRWAIESGRVAPDGPVTEFQIECPCGPVTVRAEVREGRVGHVEFDSVPSFVEAEHVELRLRNGRSIVADIAYGGAYYAIVPATRLGLSLGRSPIDDLRQAACDITETLRADYRIRHPYEEDLSFLYGAILTNDSVVRQGQINHHLCFFADGQLDRSPTGSGVSARLALAYKRGEVQLREACRFAGVTGEPFTGKVASAVDYAMEGAVITTVGGRAYYTGRAEFWAEKDDPLGKGWPMPKFFEAAR